MDKARYRTRKGEIVMNLLASCSQDIQFIYVLIGWEGSTPNSKVLRDAVSRRNGLKISHGKRKTIKNGSTFFSM